MEKSRIIYYIILLSFIAYIFYPRDTCKIAQQKYANLMLDIEIKKVSKLQRVMEVEGLDKQNKYIKWVDIGSILFNNNEKITIGSHIVKEKGDSLFRIYRNDSIISTFYYECGR